MACRPMSCTCGCTHASSASCGAMSASGSTPSVAACNHQPHTYTHNGHGGKTGVQTHRQEREGVACVQLQVLGHNRTGRDRGTHVCDWCLSELYLCKDSTPSSRRLGCGGRGCHWETISLASRRTQYTTLGIIATTDRISVTSHQRWDARRSLWPDLPPHLALLLLWFCLCSYRCLGLGRRGLHQRRRRHRGRSRGRGGGRRRYHLPKRVVQRDPPHQGQTRK